MRILLVNYRYFISGGPEKYLFNIKEKLEQEGHEVIPFSTLSNKNVETPYARYFVEPIGCRDATYYEECKKTPKVIVQMICRSVYSQVVKKAVKRIIADTKPDLVYILHYVNKLSPSVIRGAKQMKLPVVLRLSDYFLLCPRFDFLYQKEICEECLTKGYRSCIKKRCIKGSLFASFIRVFSMQIHKLIKIYDDIDVFVTPSNFIKEKLTANGFEKKKIYCIPTFTADKREMDLPVIGTYGLYFGRLTEEKGVDTLVRAYENLPPSYRLVIAGDDTTSEGIRLKNYVRANKLSNIEFTGFKLGTDLDRIIQGAKFTFIPSLWYDNLPNTALESFQYSKPVLASNIGSLPELVIPGVNGYLFQPGNVEEVTELVKKMEDCSLVREMGENSRALLNSRFSAETHYNNLIEIFNSLITKEQEPISIA